MATLQFSQPSIEPAPRGRRLGAFLVDVVAIAVVYGIASAIWDLFLENELPLVLMLAGLWMAFSVGGARRGQSLGKQLLRLRVVDREGDVPGLGRMLVRDWVLRGFFGFWILMEVLSLLPGDAGNAISGIVFGTLVLAALWCLWDRSRQCLWDKAMKTHVAPAIDAATRMVPMSSSRQAAENLKTLEDMHERGLLTDEEYEERRARELADL